MADDLEMFDSLESEEQFWQVLDDVVSSHCSSHELIDNALRGWLYLAAKFRDRFLDSEDDVAACSQKLLASELFIGNRDYVRTQIIYSLLQEDEAGPLHVIASFLLLDGRADVETFARMIEAACFPRLLELINGASGTATGTETKPSAAAGAGAARTPCDARLHRLLLQLMYEMSRVERLRAEDLLQVDDAFVTYLFSIIEEASDDVNDPYHYPIIRVLLVLNEQYMVAATSATTDPSSPTAPLTNRVLKILSMHGPRYRTFGENIILLLNRETETSLQLLILKLFYLLFTSKATYEYFYTNDLRVLLDVIIRNLLDLPDDQATLRHLYLRVLSPLLANTQLSQPPHYKREEIIKVLKLLGGAGNVHFAPADETTLRLVDRVSKVPWLVTAEDDSPVAPSEEEKVARKFLGISLSNSQAASNISVVDVAAVMEKPGVKTPSRRAEVGGAAAAADDDDAETIIKPKDPGLPTIVKPKRTLPEVPKHKHGVPYAHSPTATLHVTGHGIKKLPPKAPPRRRTKLKHAEPAVADAVDGSNA